VLIGPTGRLRRCSYSSVAAAVAAHPDQRRRPRRRTSIQVRQQSSTLGPTRCPAHEWPDARRDDERPDDVRARRRRRDDASARHAGRGSGRHGVAAGAQHGVDDRSQLRYVARGRGRHRGGRRGDAAQPAPRVPRRALPLLLRDYRPAHILPAHPDASFGVLADAVYFLHEPVTRTKADVVRGRFSGWWNTHRYPSWATMVLIRMARAFLGLNQPVRRAVALLAALPRAALAAGLTPSYAPSSSPPVRLHYGGGWKYSTVEWPWEEMVRDTEQRGERGESFNDA